MNNQQQMNFPVHEIDQIDQMPMKYREMNKRSPILINEEDENENENEMYQQNNRRRKFYDNNAIKEINEDNYDSNENTQKFKDDEENDDNENTNNMNMRRAINEEEYMNEIYDNNYDDNNNYPENRNKYQYKMRGKKRYINEMSENMIEERRRERFNVDDRRRMDRFNRDKYKRNLFNEQRFINEEQPIMQVQKVKIKEFNDYNSNNNNYNEQIPQKNLYNNSNKYNNINQPMPNCQIKQNIKYNRNNCNFFEDNRIAHEDQSVSIQDIKTPKSQKRNYNQNENININSPNLNLKNKNIEESKNAGVVKQKRNYQLYTSNYSKSGQNIYVSKNYLGSDKTTFMENKKENNTDMHKSKSQEQIDIVKRETSKEKKTEKMNPNILNSRNTKVINVISLDQYIEKQNSIRNNNSQNNPETIVLIANNPKESNIIPQQRSGQIQIISQNQDSVQSINQNQINNNLSPNYYKPNVLYPKEGYGNSEIKQKQLKKKKRIIYVRRKPIVMQHYDFQIIQSQPYEDYPIMNQQYQQHQQYQQYDGDMNNYQNEIQTFKPNQNNFQNSDSRQKIISNEDNKVPPVQNRYQNLQNFNPQLTKIYPPEDHFIYNFPNQQKQYFSMKNNRIPFIPYIYEELEKYNHRIPHTPKQTLISVTPMRTMKEPLSPEDRDIPYYSENRYYNRNYRSNRNRDRGFMPLTPEYVPRNIRRRQYEFEDERYFNDNNYEIRRKNYNNSLHRQRNMDRDRSMIPYDDEEPINDDNYNYSQYKRGQRIRRSNY